MKLLLVSSLAAIALSTGMRAQAQPANAAHVDPQAPCYRWPAIDLDGDGVFDRIDHCVNTKKGCVVDKYGCETDADGDGVCDGRDRCPDTPAGTKVDAFGCPEGRRAASEPIPTKPAVMTPSPPSPPPAPMERQLIETGSIRLEKVYFESGSAKLLPESEETLREAGEALEKYPYLRIEVQGHTDTRGSSRFNRRLSQTRAEAVRAFLVDHFQLNAKNIVAEGYGETQPETRERNDEELLRNRRVVLHVLNPEALPRRVKVEH